MKFVLAIVLLCSPLFIFSQRSKKLSGENPATLAKLLTENSTTELQKVTSIFRWITDNISYKMYSSGDYRRNGSPRHKQLDDDDTSALKPLDERIAEQVLQEREGVCVGYARLFKTLCDYAGIRSEIITGYAKTNNNKPRFGPNHYWNAVMIDTNWYLLDATWASGYIFRGEFVREYDARYFLTAPKNFILDHYPDDPRWSLLNDSPLPGEFYDSPFKQKSFIKYKIASYYPRTGIIEAAVGDTLRFSLETEDPQRDQSIIPDLLIDTTIFSHSPAWIFLKPNVNSEDPYRFDYTYVITSPAVEWLYLVYNDDLVLRYKMKLKKETVMR